MQLIDESPDSSYYKENHHIGTASAMFPENRTNELRSGGAPLFKKNKTVYSSNDDIMSWGDLKIKLNEEEEY